MPRFFMKIKVEMSLFRRINLRKTLCRCVSSRRIKGKVEIPDANKIAEPWNERKSEMKNIFETMQPKKSFVGPDFLKLLQTPLDFSPENVKRWYIRKMEMQEEASQEYIQERLEILGPDLAAAHFVVHRGGAVRFYNEKEWVRKDKEDDYVLPSKHVPGLFVEAIDLKGMVLRANGLENILDLPRLRWLSLANNPLVDDWTLDSVSGSYGEILQYLDISHCRRVSHRALSCFYRFQKLDTLVVEGISQSDEFKLSCMMLEDLKPMLTIKGIDYTVPEDVLKAASDTKVVDK